MPPSLYPNYPPALTPEQQAFLTTTIKDWSISHGLAIRPGPTFFKDAATQEEVDPHMALATTAPVTLFPSLVPRNCYHEALKMQTAYNEVYSRIVMDEGWLGKVIEELADIDDYIKRLWEVHLAVKKEGYAQDICLGLFRSDYMVHMDPSEQNPRPAIRQVEFNTIASSFGGLASRVSSLHKYLLTSACYPSEAASIIRPDSLPSNISIEALAKGLAGAHSAYGSSKSTPERMLCIVMIVQDPERNTFDQKHIEYSLQSQSGLRIFRLPFNRVLEDTKVDANTRALIYTPPAYPDRKYEVTTVYLRAGYSPSEYEDSGSSNSGSGAGSTGLPRAWQSRLHLERSAAIKCPSVLTHLAGSKKIQQILATPGSEDLARFLPYEHLAARLRKTFAPMYPLDDSPEGQEARKIALDAEKAKRYVLKPQREGGGNNIYRSRIPTFLKEQDQREWAQYVLMEMIETPSQKNVILRDGKCMEGGVICELGVFGVSLWRNPGKDGKPGEILANFGGDGSLLRTKGDSSEEGGVAAGFGAVDSCCLVDV